MSPAGTHDDRRLWQGEVNRSPSCGRGKFQNIGSIGIITAEAIGLRLFHPRRRSRHEPGFSDRNFREALHRLPAATVRVRSVACAIGFGLRRRVAKRRRGPLREVRHVSAGREFHPLGLRRRPTGNSQAPPSPRQPRGRFPIRFDRHCGRGDYGGQREV